MQKLTIAVGVFFAVLVAGVMILPSVIDWNRYKPEIQDIISQAMGRAVTIKGDISLGIFPTPNVTLNDVTIANLKDGKAPYLARLKSLEIAIALAPLIGGDIKVEGVWLEAPELQLERLADGRVNWTFDKLTAPSAAAAGRDGRGVKSSAPQIAIDRIEIRNGHLRYRDTAGRWDEEITDINFNADMQALGGPFTATGSIRYRDLPVNFDVRLGKLRPGRSSTVKLSLQAASAGDFKSEFSGSLTGLQTAPSLAGKFSLSMTNLSQALKAVGRNGGLPVAVSLQGALAANQKGFSLSKSEWQIDGIRGIGDIALGLRNGLDFDLDLRVKSANLDRIRKIFAASRGRAAADPGQKPQEPSRKMTAKNVPLLPVLPLGVKGKLRLRADGIILNGGLVRQARLSAQLADGVLTVSRFGALLPGGSDFTLSGRLGPTAAGQRLTGKIEAASNNLRSLLSWLKIKSLAPPGRLTNMTLTADIESDDKLLRLGNLQLRFDASRVTGEVSMRLQTRPSLGVSLALDRINLDGYLPPPTVSSVRNTAADSATGGSAPSSGVGKGGAWGRQGFALLNDFDANFRLRIGQLRFRRKQIKGVEVDAQLFAGQLELRKLLISDAEGVRLALKGKARDFADRPWLQLRVDADARRLAVLGHLLDIPLPPALSGLAQPRLEFSINGHLDDFRLTASAGAGGITALAEGQLRLVGGLPKVDISLRASHDSLRGLSNLFSLGIKPRQGADAPVTFQAHIRGGLDLATLDAKLSLAGGEMKIVGDVANLPLAPTVNLSISLRHSRIRRLMTGLGLSYRPAGKSAQRLLLLGTLKAKDQTLRLSNLNGSVAGTVVEGDLAADFAGPRPDLKVTLKLGKLDLDRFLATDPAGRPTGASSGGKLRRKAPGARRWSRRNLDFAALRAIDVTANIEMEQLRFNDIPFDRALVDLRLQDGVLDVRRITAQLFDGAITASGQLDVRTKPVLRTQFKMSDVQLQKLLMALAGSRRASGIANAEGDLRTKGHSEWDLIANLNGQVGLFAKDGYIEDVDFDRAASLFENSIFFPALISGLMEAMSTGRTRFVDLGGDWKVQNGVARTSNSQIKFRTSQVASRGSVDLLNWRMRLDNKVTFKAGRKATVLGVRLQGPLDRPEIKLDEKALQGDLGVKIEKVFEKKLLPLLDEKIGAAAGKLLQGLFGGQQKK